MVKARHISLKLVCKGLSYASFRSVFLNCPHQPPLPFALKGQVSEKLLQGFTKPILIIHITFYLERKWTLYKRLSTNRLKVFVQIVLERNNYAAFCTDWSY